MQGQPMADISRYRAAPDATAGGWPIIKKTTFSPYSYCRSYEAGMIRVKFPTLLLGTALLLAGPAELGPTAASAQGCLSQSEARAAVSRGDAQSFSNFHGSLQQQGQVVSSCLVRRGNSYEYQGKLVKPNGQVETFRRSAN